MITFNRRELVYLVGRAALLFSRPAHLLICNHFYGNRVAALVAAAFLVAAMLNVVSAVDSHRLYYSRRFGASEGSAARPYARYIYSLSIMALAGFGVSFGYFYLVELSAALGIAAGCYYVTERLADEVLRYTLFQRERAMWGLLALGRVVGQLTCLGLVILVKPGTNAAALFVFALFCGNLMAFGHRLPFGLVKRAFRNPRLVPKHLREGMALVLRSGLIWSLSIATMFSSYLDRLIVLVASKQSLAAFSLVVVSMSVVQTAVEYFFFSQRRRDFLEGTIKFVNVVYSRQFHAVLLGSLVCGFALTFVNLKLYSGAPDVSFALMASVAIIQISLATSSILREIAYWNNQLHALFRAEVVFLAMVAVIFGALYFLKPPYFWLVAGAAVALVVRLFLLARIESARLPFKI